MNVVDIQKKPTSRIRITLKVTLFVLVCVTLVRVYLGLDITAWLQPQDQTSCSCEKCLSDDNLLLSHRLNYSVELFLSDNYNLSEVGFKWWKGLQSERCNFSFYEATVEKLLEIFPSSPDLEKPSSDRCRTCAVVGNSVNLKGSQYGPLIDSQDIIMRINAGQTKGYEADVGSKTTHRLMYPESAVALENSTHLVLFPFKILDLKWLIKAFPAGHHGRSHMTVRSKIKANKDLVMVVNPDFMMYVHEVWLQRKGRYPSTGFMALVLALYICDEVCVFGFGADSDGNWSHYWEKLKYKNLKTGPHPGQYEYSVIQRLAERKKIKLYKGF